MRPGPKKLRRSSLVGIGLLAVLFTGLGIAWFFANFEKKEFEVHEDVSPAARQNPLLAAENYLRALGQPAKTLRDMEFFNHLPPAGEAVFIHRLPAALDRTVSDRLYDWVQAGGHLVFVPGGRQGEHPGRGDLAERLGVRFQEKAKAEGDCGCPSSADKKEQGGETAGSGPKDDEEHDEGEAEISPEETRNDVLLEQNIEGSAIRLKYFHGALLEGGGRPADYRIGGPDEGLSDNGEKRGDWLLDYRIGAGRITVLSDPRLFHNQAIGEYDHAFFLSWLLRDAERVWLLYDLEAESLPGLLARRLPELWLSLLVLLILAVWKAQQRIGIPLRPESADRRNFLAHIDAVGFHHWRTDRAGALLAVNRRNLLQEWAGRRLGRPAGQDNSDIDLDGLAKKSGLSHEEVREAFALKAEGEQDLIRIGRAMQKIEMQGKAAGQAAANPAALHG